MENFILVILGIILASFSQAGYESAWLFVPRVSPFVYLPQVLLLYFSLNFLVGFVYSRRLRRALADPAAADPYFALGRAGTFELVLRYSSLFFFAYLLFSERYGKLVGEWTPFNAAGGGGLILDSVLLILPFFALLFAHWLAFYLLHNQLRGGNWRLRGFLRHKAMSLLPTVPFLAFHALEDLQALVLKLAAEYSLFDARAVGAALENNYLLLHLKYVLIFAALFLLLPVGVKILLPSRPMPPGPVRDMLHRVLRDAKVAVRGIYVWDTQGARFSNAMVTGLIAPLRYVFVTDEILESFPPGELKAVFGHEVGHIKMKHLVFFLALPLVFLFGWWVVFDWVNVSFTSSDFIICSLSVASFIAFLGGFFGVISRRFEREADLIGAATAGTSNMIGALERISGSMKSLGKLSTWRHYSPAVRVTFLEKTSANPGLATTTLARTAVLKAILVVLLIVAIVAAVPLLHEITQISYGDAAKKEGDLATAEKYYRKAIELGDNWTYRDRLANLLDRKGREMEIAGDLLAGKGREMEIAKMYREALRYYSMAEDEYVIADEKRSFHPEEGEELKERIAAVRKRAEKMSEFLSNKEE